MKLLKWLNKNLEMSICIMLMTLMTVLIFVQVIMRYVFSNSLTWSEELARYAFIWLIYFGISYGAKIMKHLKIDAFLSLFPQKARPLVEILGDILFFVFAIFIVYTSFGLVQKQLGLGQRSPAMGIPMAVIYAAPMVGFALTVIRQAQAIVYRIRVLKNGEPASEGEEDILG